MFSSMGWRDVVSLSAVLVGIVMIVCAAVLTP